MSPAVLRAAVAPSLPSVAGSQPGSLVSGVGRLDSTEDLYCDDELHPSLQHQPNMRLTDEHLLDRLQPGPVPNYPEDDNGKTG